MGRSRGHQEGYLRWRRDLIHNARRGRFRQEPGRVALPFRGNRADVRNRVNRVILANGHPFPVFTAKQTCQASFGMSQRCHKQTKLDQMALDHVLIPFEPDARHIGYMQLPVFELIWRLENRICPILPLKPMRSFRDAHHVSSDLRVEVS